MDKIWCAIKSMILGASILALLTSCAKDTVEFETISDSQKPEGQGMLLSRQSQDNNKDKGFAEGELESLDSTGEYLFSPGFCENRSVFSFTGNYAFLLSLYGL